MTNFVQVSSGADSTALALHMWETGEDFEMVFADTGAEFPEVYHLLPRLANTVRKPLRVVSNKSFFQWLVQWGYFLPGHGNRWCTRHLKLMPLNNIAEPGDSIFVGIRADEPARAENILDNNELAKFPLVEAGFDKVAVKSLCNKYDLLNPLYKWRSSVSCFCCYMQRKQDWLGMLQHHPDLFAVAEIWEEQSKNYSKGYTWTGMSLSILRSNDEAQLKLFPEPKVKPCLICAA